MEQMGIGIIFSPPVLILVLAIRAIFFGDIGDVGDVGEADDQTDPLDLDDAEK